MMEPRRSSGWGTASPPPSLLCLILLFEFGERGHIPRTQDGTVNLSGSVHTDSSLLGKCIMNGANLLQIPGPRSWTVVVPVSSVRSISDVIRRDRKVVVSDSSG